MLLESRIKLAILVWILTLFRKNIFIHISFIETGSEEVIQGMKILDDRMVNIDNNEDLTFYMESYEECQLECNERYLLKK